MIDSTPDQDDWTQRLKENPSNPLANYIRQVHEEWLTELEGLAVDAIASNDWDAFYAHVVDFQNEHELHGETVIAFFSARCVQPLDTSGSQAPKVCPAQALAPSPTECYEPREQGDTPIMTESTKTFQITAENQPPEVMPLRGWNLITHEFPEFQYIGYGVDEATAKKLGDAFRAGEAMPQTEVEVLDRISSRLVQHSHYGKGGQQ